MALTVRRIPRCRSVDDPRGPVGRDVVAAIARCPLFEGLSSDDRRAVAQSARVLTAPAGSALFSEGQHCRGLWVLVSGQVRLSHAGVDGRQQIVGFRAPGGVLDLGPVLDGREHMATATAVDTVSVAVIPHAAVQELLLCDPAFARRAIAELCLELRRHDIWAAVLSFRDSRGRIGCALTHLALEYGVKTADGLRIDYRLTRQDLADRAGVRLETAIRIVSDLQRQGILRSKAQVIDVPDIGTLRSVAGCRDCQFDCSIFERRACALP